jgi:hypothetical protein
MLACSVPPPLPQGGPGHATVPHPPCVECNSSCRETACNNAVLWMPAATAPRAATTPRPPSAHWRHASRLTGLLSGAAVHACCRPAGLTCRCHHSPGKVQLTSGPRSWSGVSSAGPQTALHVTHTYGTQQHNPLVSVLHTLARSITAHVPCSQSGSKLLGCC